MRRRTNTGKRNFTVIPVIKTENLTHVYSSGTPFEMTAVKDINIEINSGEFISIIGETGSGKSTLIQHLNGLIKPTSGKIYITGEDIHSSKETLRSVRFKVGLVFQYPEYQLFEETVYKDVAFGPKNMGLKEDEIDARVREAIKFVKLDEFVLDESPFELSGGQKRRVAIAGVIAMRPEVLILDEPTAGLDPQGCDEIIANIRAYHDSTGAAIIMVTHNMTDAAENADRMLVLSKGSVVMQGSPREVFSRSGELVRLGLDVPEAEKIAYRLRKLGVPVSEDIYTNAQLIEELKALKGGVSHA